MKLLTAVITVIALSYIALLAGCGGTPSGEDKAAGSVEAARARERSRSADFLQRKDAPVFGYEIINTYHHDTDNYTQGLALDEGLLYEGTGRYNQSKLVKTELETGTTLREHRLQPEYFGEGVTVLGDDVYQLTYMSNTGFIYDKDSLEPTGTFDYPTQGWGLTDDGRELIKSDGSATLCWLDSETLQETGSVTVSDNQGPVRNLNELEYIDGEVYANVFKTALIAIIDPGKGEVDGWIDLAGLNPDPLALRDPYVLNGIAYREETGHLLVTGKCWPTIFEIRLIPK